MEIVLNGKVEQLSGQLTVAELIAHLELQPKQVAVEVNRELVPRDQHAACNLAAGDQVEVVTLVGGG
jgi:sulfur carrier protein